MTLPNLQPRSWQQVDLPDFVWVQAIRELTGGLDAASAALDVLDGFVPDPSAVPADRMSQRHEGRAPRRGLAYLDGRVPQFDVVPADRRADAREALRRQVPEALSDELGHALALHPDCPAGWMFDDWRQEHHADPVIGAAFLKRVVAPLLDPRGRPSSQVRLLSVARMFKHDMLHLTEDTADIVELLVRYPHGLDEEDQLHVEQWGRSVAQAAAMALDDVGSDTWAKAFWRNNWRVSPCDLDHVAPSVDVEENDAGELPADQEPGPRAPTVSDVRAAFVEAIDELGRELRQLQHRAEFDIFEPVANEVQFGLASRIYRLLRRLVADPNLWTNDMAPHIVRSIIDARIVSAWLIAKDDQALYARYKDYGLGKRKLFKLQLEKLMDQDEQAASDANQALHQSVADEVNEDVLEEFIKIDVGGSFSGKSIRDMAQDTGLGELYSLSYQPLSTEAHGEWNSLVSFDLQRCANPLHRYHRLGAFDTAPGSYVHIGWLYSALNVAEEAISAIFGAHNVDVAPAFTECGPLPGDVLTG